MTNRSTSVLHDVVGENRNSSAAQMDKFVSLFNQCNSKCAESTNVLVTEFGRLSNQTSDLAKHAMDKSSACATNAGAIEALKNKVSFDVFSYDSFMTCF